MTVVNTNINALVSQNAVSHNERALNQSMARLATGQRINSAADDAAGLAIGNKMSAQIVSLNQSVRNANDGISMLQTADGAAGGITDVLQRMRELSIQAANDTNSSSDRTALNIEFGELKTEMDNIINTTRWNDQRLLKDESGTKTFHVGANAGNGVSVSFANLYTDASITAVRNIASAQTANAVTVIDTAINQLSSTRAVWGASMNRLSHAADNASNVSLNLSESRSRIMDTDYAQTTAELARSMILNQAGSAMLSQANQHPYYVLALLS